MAFQAEGVQVKAFVAQGSVDESSHQLIRRIVNRWLEKNPRTEVLDLQFQFAVVSPKVDGWTHTAFLVYRENPPESEVGSDANSRSGGMTR